MKNHSLLFLFISLLQWGFLQAEPISNWQNAKWETLQLSDQPSLRSSAIKEGVFWVAGTKGKIFKSIDFGENWQDVSLNNNSNEDIRDIHAFNSQSIIVMTVGEGKQSRLYQTIDAGENWHILLQNTEEKGFFDSIGFWDNNKGLLLGDPVDGYYVIMTTEDAGKNWQRINSNGLPKILDKEAAFAASGNTLVTGKNGKAWFTTGGFSASVMFSNDYGKTWKRQPIPLYDATQTAGGYGLRVNNKDEIFVVGGDYQKRDGQYSNLVSLDADSKWHQIATGNNGLRTAMSCIKANCIITGKLGSDISFDHGKHWQEMSGQGFYTLATDGQYMIAAGHVGRVGILKFNKN